MAVVADRLAYAVEHGLRRINVAIAAKIRIALLPYGMRVKRERVAPAEIVPVIDGKAQRDETRVVRELAKQLVRLGAGRAALTGEQLNDRLRLFNFTGY